MLPAEPNGSSLRTIALSAIGTVGKGPLERIPATPPIHIHRSICQFHDVAFIRCVRGHRLPSPPCAPMVIAVKHKGRLDLVDSCPKSPQQGISSRPVFNSTPWPGPVYTHFQSSGNPAKLVMSTGSDELLPSSVGGLKFKRNRQYHSGNKQLRRALTHVCFFSKVCGS